MPTSGCPVRSKSRFSTTTGTIRPFAAVENDIPFEYKQDCYREFGWSGQTAARYVRLKARHNGHPGGWIFTDEIIVE